MLYSEELDHVFALTFAVTFAQRKGSSQKCKATQYKNINMHFYT